MNKTYYTYIRFDKDDNFYIGSASCYGDPAKHKYFGSGRAIQTGEFKPIRKQILSLFMTRKEAGLEETLLIRQADYKTNIRCMNKACAGLNHTNGSAKKKSKARSGENNPMYGKTHSEETRAKMSEANKDKALSAEHRAKISEAKKGKTHSAEARAKISKAKKDIRLHRFVHESGQEIIGIYCELRQNRKELFGIGYSSIHNLKKGYIQSVKGWSYAGIVDAY